MATGIPIELEQEYNRNKVLKQFFAENQTKVDAYAALKARQTIFESNLSYFESLIPGKDVVTKGITLAKAELKTEIAVGYSSICLITRSFALTKGLDDLAANLNYPKSKILRMADGELLPFVVATNKLITDEAMPDPDFADYGITPARLGQALTAATQYNSLIGQAGAIESGISGVIEELTAASDQLSDDVYHFDLLMSVYRQGDPGFYAGFETAKTIDDIGVHHSGIQGIVFDAEGRKLKDVEVVCVQNTKKKDKTDLMGEYEIVPFKPGVYEFTFSKAGYAPKTIVFRIEKGKVKTQDVTLESA